jgi:hypothetical protein
MVIDQDKKYDLILHSIFESNKEWKTNLCG